MPFDFTGTLIEIFEEQQISEKFRKREFVVEIPGQYPEQIKLQLVQDRCDIIDPYKVGQEVKVDFNLRGRGFNKNGQMLYFTNLEAWRIQPVNGTEPKPNVPPARTSQPQAGAPITSDEDNDLPF